LDLLGAALVLPIALVLTPLIALAIRFDSPGPILYRQQRIGLGGQLFTIYKFRSMYVDAETRGAQWAQERDPRVTRVGRFLRASRLDEIPQVWNVLKGDMSLVGPRPERPEFAQLLHQTHSEFLARHSVKPGLTGLAQVAHCYTTSLEDWGLKLHYDLKYIKEMCTILDLRILVRTLLVVLNLRGV
jgi:lipopolysaccharide/colanic/teichoic acid biosynthesis glycosyltransferase